MDAISIGLWSYHLNRDEQLNEVHNLVGYQHDHAFVAWYNNSHNRDTIVGGYVTNERCWQYVCGDVILGLATGYEEQSGMRLTPFVVPRLKLELTDRIGVNVLAVPGQLVAVGFEVEF